MKKKKFIWSKEEPNRKQSEINETIMVSANRWLIKFICDHMSNFNDNNVLMEKIFKRSCNVLCTLLALSKFFKTLKIRCKNFFLIESVPNWANKNQNLWYCNLYSFHRQVLVGQCQGVCQEVLRRSHEIHGRKHRWQGPQDYHRQMNHRNRTKLIVKIDGEKVEDVEDLRNIDIDYSEDLIRCTLPQGVSIRNSKCWLILT